MAREKKSIKKILEQIDKEKEGLQKDQAAIRDRKKKLNTLKKVASSEKKKVDTRKKVLVGAMVLNEAEVAGEMDGLINRLDKFLKRNTDREVFDLPAI